MKVLDVSTCTIEYKFLSRKLKIELFPRTNKTMDNDGYIPLSSRICFMTAKSPNIKNERQK